MATLIWGLLLTLRLSWAADPLPYFDPHSPVEEKSPAQSTTKRTVSDSKPICEDLATFTCAPGEYDDGTGKVSTPSAVNSPIEKIKDQIAKLGNETFSKVIKDPANGYFRKMAIGILGLDSSFACSSSEPEDKETCEKNLALGLSELAVRRLFKRNPEITLNTPIEFTPQPSLEQFDLIISNPAYKAAEAQLREETSNRMINPEAEKNVREKIFPQVRQMLMELIRKIVPDETARTKILDKIHNVSLSNSGCLNGFDSDVSLGSEFERNASYNTRANVVSLCRAMLSGNPSVFNIVFTLAHELAHTVGPCAISVGPANTAFHFKSSDPKEALNEYPIPGLLACLRSEESVGARSLITSRFPKRDVSEEIDPFLEAKPPKIKLPAPEDLEIEPIEIDAKAIPIAKPKKPVKPEPRPFCASPDQLEEAVPDYLASHVLPDYIAKYHPDLLQPAPLQNERKMANGYSNAFRDACEWETIDKEDIHPSFRNRINRILLLNPKVRKQLKCKVPHSTYKHCPPDGDA